MQQGRRVSFESAERVDCQRGFDVLPENRLRDVPGRISVPTNTTTETKTSVRIAVAILAKDEMQHRPSHGRSVARAVPALVWRRSEVTATAFTGRARRFRRSCSP